MNKAAEIQTLNNINAKLAALAEKVKSSTATPKDLDDIYDLNREAQLIKQIYFGGSL